ncbi:MAG: ABC transporter permease [Verrucomicrobiae bacterium]|nr:ABC transporter permease [Verrucomicrobiae bacterium]
MKFALRQLLKNPGFTAVAVLTLALGIGASTAIFSVIYGVLINPYPYARPGEIWTPGVSSAGGDQRMRPYRLDEYLEMGGLPVFSEVMATGPGSALLTGEYAPETVRAVRVSGNAFHFLGVPPVLGRALQPSDIRSTGEPEAVAVLTYNRWQRMFGGDPNVLGKTLRLDEEPHTIVGVMPPRFGWWTDDGVWLPLGTNTGNNRSVFPIARLKAGVAAPAAAQQLDTLFHEFAKAHPSGFPNETFAATLTNYLDITAASGELQRSLQLLLGAVGFLLLIACANVANLQLARSTVRVRDIAIRLAMGAGRGQIVRQLLTESVLLSLAGGALGLLFAYLITHLMVTLMPGFYVPNESRIEVNRQVLFFCALVSVLTGILFGLAPALQSSRPNLIEVLKDETRGTAGASSGGRTRALLVVAEVALSVVLLVSAGLTIHSFVALQRVDLGFRPENVLTVDLPLAPQRYATRDQRNRFAQELLERVQNIPGVRAAAIGNGGLPFGGPQSPYVINAQAGAENQRIVVNLVSADYLRVTGVPLRRGRMSTRQEVEAADRVVVLNETAAKLWPAGEDPIGRQFRLELLERPGSPSVLAPTNASAVVTVIGIVGDTRNDGVQSEPLPAALVPFTLLAPTTRALALRGDTDPRALLNALRTEIRAMDPEQPTAGVATFEERLGFETAQPRFTMALFSLFAALGLTLAMAGIYSVLSYLVLRRTREIGVRMALGAQQSDVHRLIFQTGGKLVGIGLLVGVLASLGVARLLGSQLGLFGVTMVDPISYAAVTLLLGLTTAAACFLPARRAARVDPMEALRTE